jgi:adenine-specific DNA glycosylase
VLERYHGNAAELWPDAPTAMELRRRLEEFPGIGQKKAAMAVEILARDLGVELKDLSGGDIAYDVHVRRVFLRTGLAERDDVNHMVAVARALHPERPGALDLPAWDIGRRWCRPSNPDCPACPLNSACPRLVDRGSGVKGAQERSPRRAWQRRAAMTGRPARRQKSSIVDCKAISGLAPQLAGINEEAQAVSRTMTRDPEAERVINSAHRVHTIAPVSRPQERMSISMTPADRALIESAARAAGVSVSAWMVHAAREEARWAVARQITGEIAAEFGVTDADREWAASVLGLDAND